MNKFIHAKNGLRSGLKFLPGNKKFAYQSWEGADYEYGNLVIFNL
jgi:hypothetical protein